MMQIKFNLNNFRFYGVSASAWQRASGIRRRRRRLWLAAAVCSRPRGLSNNDVIALRPLRSLHWCVALDENPVLFISYTTGKKQFSTSLILLPEFSVRKISSVQL